MKLIGQLPLVALVGAASPSPQAHVAPTYCHDAIAASMTGGDHVAEWHRVCRQGEMIRVLSQDAIACDMNKVIIPSERGDVRGVLRQPVRVP